MNYGLLKLGDVGEDLSLGLVQPELSPAGKVAGLEVTQRLIDLEEGLGEVAPLLEVELELAVSPGQDAAFHVMLVLRSFHELTVKLAPDILEHDDMLIDAHFLRYVRAGKPGEDLVDTLTREAFPFGKFLHGHVTGKKLIEHLPVTVLNRRVFTPGHTLLTIIHERR